MNDGTNAETAEAAPKHRGGAKLSDEDIKAIVASQRAYRRQQRYKRFRAFNSLAWFFDEFPPQDMYRDFENKRSTRQEVRYYALRRHTSWTFLSHMKSASGAWFAAAAGLVSAVFQGAPELHAPGSVAMSFRWLFFAGIFYLCAVVWFEVFCPVLLKQTMSVKKGALGPHGRRWLQVLTEDELRRWWDKREWVPKLSQLDPRRMEDQTIAAALGGYGIPAFAGFGVYARAHIELALAEFGETLNVKLWETRRGGDRKWELAPFSPKYSYEGSRPVVELLRVRDPESAELSEQKEVSTDDLVLDWYSSGIQLSHAVPSRRDIIVSDEAEGMHHLFSTDERAHIFSGIIARWQDWLHPWRRLGLIVLYGLSFGCFGWFVISQSIILLDGLSMF